VHMFFARLINLLRRSRVTAVPSDSTIPVSEMELLTIPALWNNFDKRTWHYERLKSTLQQNDPRLLNWTGSIDYSGRTRELCLKYLISNFVPGDENRILLRLADWVPQVRNLASKWVLNNFETLPFDAIMKNDLLILFLSRKEQLSSDSALHHINAVLLAKAGSLGKKEFLNLKPSFRRYLFKLSLKNDQAFRKWLLEDNDPFNRLLLLNHPVCQELMPEEIAALKKDKSAYIRRRYLYMQIEKGIQPCQRVLTEFVFDRNPGLREIGRFYLKKYYGVDAYDLYKTKQNDYFYYIADFAKKEDIGHFINGLRSNNKAIRLICLKALSIADSQELKNLNIQAILLENRKIREIISWHLPQLLSLDELFALRDTFDGTSSNGIIYYLNLIARKSYWQFVDTALSEVLVNPTDTLFNYLDGVILSKSYIYVNMPEVLRQSIIDKLSSLQNEHYHRARAIITLLESLMKTT
jgi:hypothetical protein